MTKKKILSVVPAPLLPAVSGGQKGTYGPLNALGKIANVISITDTKSTTKGHTFNLLPLIKHEPKKYLSIKSYRILKREIEKEKPNSLLLEQPFMGLVVYWVSKKSGIPFFVHAHNIEYMRFKSLGKFWWPLMFVLERFTFKHATGIFFVTRFDKDLAIKTLKVAESKCHVTPYGIPQEKPLSLTQEKINEVRARHGIKPSDKVFMFFGVLKYLPNIEALELILKKINPILKERYKKDYKILICGGGLGESYNKLKDFQKDNVVYAGFVENIDEYTQSADVILNPVLSGGGIKTKIVEALGFNRNVVSTQSGAIGVDPEICGTKLYIADDKNWSDFVDKCIEASENSDTIPQTFFELFSWSAVANTMHKYL